MSNSIGIFKKDLVYKMDVLGTSIGNSVYTAGFAN